MNAPEDAIGTILGGRYRLVALLGSGRSASVYLAEDLSLQRQVAVKVVRPDHAQDPQFQARFATEARAVAALNHPSILRVYDWGDDGTTPYVVLEYLSGGSLQDHLDRHQPMSLSQVVAFGAQAARGLAYAHARDLVHGDLKPSNLLFDDEGRVRVTDFGSIEAPFDPFAQGEDDLDQDRVRYASPEEALGGTVDAKSDVYTLALMLYEAATGTPAFHSSSPIATLMARVGVPLPHHPTLGPLDDVLARAAAPEREARLDAEGLADRLDAVAQSLPAPEPLHLGPVVADTAASLPTLGFTPPSADELTQAVPVVGVTAATTAVAVAAEPATTVSAAEPPAASSAPEELTDEPARRWWPWLVGILAVLLVAAVAVIVASGVFASSALVPNVVGLTQSQATQVAQANGWSLSVGPGEVSQSVPTGQVITQSPTAGSKIKGTRTITVVVSLGPPLVTVPNVVGTSCAQALTALSNNSLVGSCPPTSVVYSSTVPAGKVAQYTYDGTVNPAQVPEGATVLLVVSSGVAPQNVPSVTGSTYPQAAATLASAGFSTVKATQASTKYATGIVIGTTPPAGTPLAKGTEVTVLVSSGPPNVAVPSVIGDTADQAVAALTAAGLTPNVVGTVGTVTTVDPPVGTQVAPGSTVTVTLTAPSSTTTSSTP